MTQLQFNTIVVDLLEKLLAEILHRNSFDTDAMAADIDTLRASTLYSYHSLRELDK